MSAIYETLDGVLVEPGDMVKVTDEKGSTLEARWSGYAKSESLRTWKAEGCLFVRVEAYKFAVKSDITKELVWEKVPPGHWLQAVVDRRTKPLFKIVTREATDKELELFQHSRIPLLVNKLTKESDIVPI